MKLQGIFGVAGALFVVTACSSGSGPLVTTTSSTGRDDPGSTYDKPPSTSDQVGGNCLACDVIYSCPNAGAVGEGISLSSSEGECTAALIAAVCSGTLFGTGPCTGNGDGSFSCGDVTCTPETADQGSSSGIGNSSSSGGTPGEGSSSGGFQFDAGG
jgi:hypothetical protein